MNDTMHAIKTRLQSNYHGPAATHDIRYLLAELSRLSTAMQPKPEDKQHTITVLNRLIQTASQFANMLPTDANGAVNNIICLMEAELTNIMAEQRLAQIKDTPLGELTQSDVGWLIARVEVLMGSTPMAQEATS